MSILSNKLSINDSCMLVCLALGLVFASVYVCRITTLYAERNIVTIDVKDIINEFLITQSNNQLSDDELNTLVDTFADNLNGRINERSRKDGTIILPRQAVITGALDITPEIKKQIFKDSV